PRRRCTQQWPQPPAPSTPSGDDAQTSQGSPHAFPESPCLSPCASQPPPYHVPTPDQGESSVSTFTSGFSGLTDSDDPLRAARQQRTDALIEANRAATPPGAAEQRAVPRMSIAELNAMDMEQIRARFLNSRRDDRPAFVRVLDLIDAPRNVVANLIFRDAARKAAVAGDTGAFGLPRVTFSDALRELGVENRVVR